MFLMSLIVKCCDFAYVFNDFDSECCDFACVLMSLIVKCCDLAYVFNDFDSKCCDFAYVLIIFKVIKNSMSSTWSASLAVGLRCSSLFLSARALFKKQQNDDEDEQRR